MNKKYIWIAGGVAVLIVALLLAVGSCQRKPQEDTPGTSQMPGYYDDSTVAPTTLPRQTEPADTTVPGDTSEPTAYTEPAVTTKPTEPAEPTRPTEPPVTTAPPEPTEPPVTTAPPEPTEPPVTTAPTQPEETVPETTEPVVTEPVDASGRLKFTTYGRYTGKFVEQGQDDYVRNVAVLLVTNISDEYLQYAVITFDISGTPAAFTVTGLNPGESAWVLEQNRLTIGADAVFTHKDDMVSFAPDNRSKTKDVSVTLGDGQLTVTNKTGKNLTGVYIYYKQRYDDGNFLGGITYRVPMGDLAGGETASAIAAHCDPATCEVVRIEWEKEE